MINQLSEVKENLTLAMGAWDRVTCGMYIDKAIGVLDSIMSIVQTAPAPAQVPQSQVPAPNATNAEVA